MIEGQYDGLVMAAAGVERLKLNKHITEYNFNIRIERPYPIPDSNYFSITVDKQKKNVLRTI